MKKMLIALMAIVLLVSCAQIPGTGEERTGLTINLDSSTSRTLQPGLSMDCASYSVVVTGTVAGEVYNQVVTGTTTLSGLLPDNYTVDVIGLNDTDTAIGSGTGSTDVLVGQTASVTITVAEYSGTGEMDIQVNWPAAIVSDPTILSTMAYGAAAPAVMSWILDGDSLGSTYNNSSLQNGFYAITYLLYDNGAANQSAGFASIARIVKDQITSGIINLQPNAATGGLEILIDFDFFNPMPINVTVPEVNGNLSLSAAPFDIVASVDPLFGAVAYVYYINGEAVEITDTLTVDPASFTLGDHYRIDLLGITADGKNAGQCTWEYTIIDNDLTLIWDPALYVTADITVATFEDGSAGNEISITIPNTGSYTYSGITPGMYSVRLRSSDNSFSEYWGSGITDTYQLGVDPVTFDFTL